MRGGYRIGSGVKKGTKPWNTGLKLKDIPKYSHMGFQKGHPPYPAGKPNKGWFTTERVRREKNVNWIDGKNLDRTK